MPGQRNQILSSAQLERQGFSIRWPSEYCNVELLRPDGTFCAIFRRTSGRLIYKPLLDLLNPELYPVQHDWYGILGHPGQKAQDIALKTAGIKGYKFPYDCETCIKTKITKSKGYSSLRSASSFGEVIHMDLVGGQKSLFPTTTDKSIPNASWFLLAVNEFTSWKWAWPVYSKRTVPSQIVQLLEHLMTKFGKTPKILYTDSGTKFSNSDLQQNFLSCGIEWHKSSSHAPEQNGIVERNVRSVTEKLRALHLQSGLPIRLWPLILAAAIYILNVTPNSVSPNSPYYSLFHTMPKIHNLHPFGCRAFWLEPDSNKLKSKAREGIYVGSEFSVGHIILNPNTQRTVVRHDDRFQENSYPLRLQVHALHLTRQVIKTALSGPRASDWNSAMNEEKII
ncbi:hypothetical protein K3495_g10481 [Podosphaera aphanis]|nr:hypothetical protein K3495_g10481 [Podosphaera aphanis]